MEWGLAEAETNIDDVMTDALTVGPQRVRRGDDVVVVLSEADYQRLIGEPVTLKDYLLAEPDLSDLDLGRDRRSMRESGLS